MSFFKSNRNIRVLLALLLAPVMAFTSCLEVIDDGSEAVGYLAPVSVAFDLSVDELTATKALPLPTIESPNEADILFVVKDQNGNVVHSDYGRWEGTLVIPVGNYTVEASYGANAFGSPYFYGSVSGKVGPYENQTLPDINLKVENSLVAVTIKDELDQHFTCETVTFKSGTTTFSGSLGEYCFVPSGRDLSVVLGGKNSMNKPSTFTYQLAKPLARSAYEVICEKASTNWPSISFTSDKIVAWANRIYVTSPADFSGAISSDNKETVVYEAIPSSSSDWSLAKTSVKDNGIPVIKRLDTGTEYKVRARAGVLVSPEVKVTPNFSGLATSAEHTSTSGLLDGTDVTVSFAHASSAVKASIKSWTLNLCKSDGTVLRSGLSIGTTSDGSQITSSTGWPYLPSGQYKVVAGVTMTDGEVVGTEVIFETGKPTFTVSVSAYTSYNKYLDRNLDFANNAANKHTVFERKTNVSISDALLSNTNYSSIRSSSITFNSTSLGTFNTNTKDFGNDADCTSWQNYPFKASMTFDGVTEEASVDCHITGLPYMMPTIIETDWTTASWNCKFSDGSLQLGGVSGSGEASATSKMKFHIPASIGVKLNTNVTVRAYKFALWYNTDFTVAVNGTTIIKQNSDKQDNNNTGKNYNLSGTSTFTPSACSVKMNSSYTAAGPWSSVHSMEILYN